MALTPAPTNLLARFRDPEDDLEGYVPVIGWDDHGIAWVQPMNVPEAARPVEDYAANHHLEYVGLVSMGQANARARREVPHALGLTDSDAQR